MYVEEGYQPPNQVEQVHIDPVYVDKQLQAYCPYNSNNYTSQYYNSMMIVNCRPTIRTIVTITQIHYNNSMMIVNCRPTARTYNSNNYTSSLLQLNDDCELQAYFPYNSNNYTSSLLLLNNDCELQAYFPYSFLYEDPDHKPDYRYNNLRSGS